MGFSIETKSLDVVFIKDSKSGGHTGYIRAIPELVAQGKTKSETVSNLLCSLIDLYRPILENKD